MSRRWPNVMRIEYCRKHMSAGNHGTFSADMVTAETEAEAEMKAEEGLRSRLVGGFSQSGGQWQQGNLPLAACLAPCNVVVAET